MRNETRFSPTLNIMVNAIKAAARGLIRDFGEVEHLQISQKSIGDFVSTADLNAEKTLCVELENARPGYSFLLEESGSKKGKDESHRWIVDPLDGTFNFLHGIPHFCISVGLEKTSDGKSEIIAGVVYNPITDELYTAEKGGGAFLNNRRIRVSNRRKINESLVINGLIRDEDVGRETNAVLNQTRNLVRFGSAALALCYVASGRADFYWETGIKPWDIAAGSIIVLEAGGTVTDKKGQKDYMNLNEVMAGNLDIHGILAPVVKKANKA